MSIPILLPPTALPPHPSTSHSHSSSELSEWRPRKYAQPPVAPPVEEGKIIEIDPRHAPPGMGDANGTANGGKLMIKKTRPRRTVDYNGGVGRYILMRKLRPNTGYLPHLRPSPSCIIDLLPPKAYSDNASTSLCTKFVHTSTNKIRCPVNVVRWTPEGRRVLTGSTSGEFTLWNGLTFNFETILQAHDTAICTLTFTHTGAYLASTDKAGIIKYFQPNMNNLTAWQGSKSREAIRGLSFSPDDARFATASDDSSVRIWAFEESREERVLTGHGWDVKCVEWHPTKGLLVSGSKDNQIKFWDPRTGNVLSTLHSHKNTIQALAWSPSGDMVASASRDQTVRVFDIRTMKEFRVLKGHKKEVCSVTWHPVHPILVSGGSEGAIIHWDLSSSAGSDPSSLPTTHGPTSTNTTSPQSATQTQLLATPTPTISPRATLSQAHDSNVWSLAYHPLGHLLVSASNDHTTRFWSRERPGDDTSVFSGGGEKPPDAMMMDGDEEMQMQQMMEEEEEMDMVPGFGGGGLPGFGDSVGAEVPGFGGAAGGYGGNGQQQQDDEWSLPGFNSSAGYDQQSSGGGYGGGSYGGGAGRSLPPQQDMYPERDSRDREREDTWSGRERERGGRGGGRRGRDRDGGGHEGGGRGKRRY